MKVRHSQRLSEKPLEAWFISTSEGVIQSAHCTCMTGLGESCTHDTALMFFVSHIALNKDEKSITSVAPYWGEPKKSVDFAEVRNIKFFSEEQTKQTALPPIIPRLNEDGSKNLYEELQSKNCQSTALSIVKGYNESDQNLFREKLLSKSLDELQAAVLKVKINIAEMEANEINAETVQQYKCRKWFLYRAGRITASSLKSVCSTDIN